MSLTVSVDEVVALAADPALGSHPNWGRVRLGEIAEILNGFAFPSSGFNPSAGMGLIRIRDINSESTETKFDGPWDDIYLVRGGDLLVGMDGDFNCAIWNGPKALLNQRVCSVKTRQEFYRSKFLVYSLPAYLRAINRATSSITVKHLSSATLREIPLPLPPLREQDRIVAEIETQFTRLDAATAALKRAQANLKRYRASVLKAACEGRLVPTEADLARQEGREYEPASQLLDRILRERRARWQAENGPKKKYREPLPPDTSALPALPKGWCWATVDQIAYSIRNGIASRPEKAGELPVLRISAVRPMRVDLSDLRFLPDKPEYRAFRLIAGDVLFTRYNGTTALVGVAAKLPQIDGPLTHPDKLIRVRTMPGGVMPEFLEIAANTGKSRESIAKNIRTTAGQSGISGGDIRKIPIPVCPKDEQERVAAAARDAMARADRLDAVLGAELRRAENIRRSILQIAFSGRLVPQDPTDEPASALLDRIRADRALEPARKSKNPKRHRAAAGKPARLAARAAKAT